MKDTLTPLATDELNARFDEMDLPRALLKCKTFAQRLFQGDWLLVRDTRIDTSPFEQPVKEIRFLDNTSRNN